MVIITEGKMKKLFTLMAASAALAFTSCDNDEIVPAEEFATSSDVKVEIAVAPMMDGTRALKTGWETGDKINIWFDGASFNELPQCVLTYDGANWVSSSVNASVLSASGEFNAIYESSNKMFQKTYENGEAYVPYVEMEDGTKIYDGILSCESSYVSYTYSSEDNKLTAEISNWYLITNNQVVVSGLTEDPSNYAMEVWLLNDTYYRSYAFEAFYFDDNYGSFSYGGTEFPVRGCANTDGVAFYFMNLPVETNANYQFRIYDIKNDEWIGCTKKGTVPSPSEGFYGIKLNAGDFRSLTFSLNVGENSIPEGTPKVTFTPNETGVYKLYVDYGFVDIPNNLDLGRSEETGYYKYTYLEKDKKYVIKTDAEYNDVTLTVTKVYDLETFGVGVEYPSLENKKIYSFVAPETALYTFVPVDGQGHVDIYDSVNVNLYGFGTQDSDNKAILFEGNRYFIVWEKDNEYPNAGLKIEKSPVGTITLGTATTVTSNTPYLLDIAEEGVYYIDIDDADAWIEIKSLDKYYNDNDKIQELMPGRYQFVYYGYSYSTTNVTIKKVEPVALGEGTTTLAANTAYKITVPENHLYKMSKNIYGIFEDADGLFYSILSEGQTVYIAGDGNPFTFEKVTSLDATPLTLGVDNAVVGKGLYSIIIPSEGNYEFRGSGDYEYGLYIFSLDGSSNYVEHEDTRWLEAGTYYFKGLSDNSANKVKFELE